MSCFRCRSTVCSAWGITCPSRPAPISYSVNSDISDSIYLLLTLYHGYIGKRYHFETLCYLFPCCSIYNHHFRHPSIQKRYRFHKSLMYYQLVKRIHCNLKKCHIQIYNLGQHRLLIPRYYQKSCLPDTLQSFLSTYLKGSQYIYPIYLQSIFTI